MTVKPIGKDYKRSRSNGFDVALARFSNRFGLRLGVAAVVYVALRQTYETELKQAGALARPEPMTAEARRPPPDEADAEPTQQYDFYDRLPNSEVTIPEKEGQIQRGLAGAPIERPGTYVLQVGSYRNQPDAERISAQLGIQGMTASVQRVAVDADVWHRVRIGPSSDLTEINRLREKLRSADLDAIVIRVGD